MHDTIGRRYVILSKIVKDIVKHLQSLCEKEGLKADDDALHLIAQKADGALRDALSIFDRISSLSMGHITLEVVTTNLNILDYESYFKVIDHLLLADTSNILLSFNDIVARGFEPDIFLVGLAEHVRNLLVAKEKATQPGTSGSQRTTGPFATCPGGTGTGGGHHRNEMYR